MDSNTHFDLLVLGGGSGGLSSARWAANKFGVKAGLIEVAELGGTCVNRGCAPKKVTLNCASWFDDARCMKDYGVKGVENLTLDFKVLKAAREGFVKGKNDMFVDLLAKSNVTHIKGWGVFKDAKTIEVDGVAYTADHMLIASGSTPVRLEFPGSEHCMVSDDFFHLEEVPKRIVLIGGGYIGTEMGQIFHSLGCKVTQVELFKVLGLVDRELVDHLIASMKGDDYDIREGIAVKSVEKIADKNFKVTFTDDSVEEGIEMVMMTAGRKANTAGMGIDEIGVKMNKWGCVEVDDYQNTNLDNVYAIGDSTMRVPLAPVAIRSGRILMERIFGKKKVKMDYSLIPTVIFSHPSIAVMGVTEDKAKE